MATLAQGTERRGSERHALMLRAAKVLTPGGELVCSVRELSSTGLRLRFYHELPQDRFLLLELGNGERYPLEAVWRKDDLIGARFGAPIDVSEFMAEPSNFARRQLRVRLKLSALLTAGQRDYRAQLVDLSQQGARIELGSQLDPLQSVRLEVPGLPLRFGQVRWRHGFAHGLFFDQPARLDEFARHVFALQAKALPETGGEMALKFA